jgi:hypothetical protein
MGALKKRIIIKAIPRTKHLSSNIRDLLSRMPAALERIIIIPRPCGISRAEKLWTSCGSSRLSKSALSGQGQARRDPGTRKLIASERESVSLVKRLKTNHSFSKILWTRISFKNRYLESSCADAFWYHAFNPVHCFCKPERCWVSLFRCLERLAVK